MVNVRYNCCSHGSCEKRPVYSVEGSLKAVFCKQHALDGMVHVIGNHCSHDSCTRHPSYNIKESKRAAYCKQHAEDGMVNVVSKRCSHDPCMRQPSYNVKSKSNKAMYCKQHATDGMVDVCSKRCSPDSCMKYPSFDVEGSKTAVYCKAHAQDGMVSVTNRCSRDRCTSGRAKGSPTNAAATAHIKRTSDRFNGSVENSDSSWEEGNRRKRSRREVDGKQPRHRLDHGPFKRDDGHAVGTGPCTEGTHTLSSVASPRYIFDNNTFRTAAKPTRPAMPRAVTTSSGDHQSVEPIKTKMELVVSL